MLKEIDNLLRSQQTADDEIFLYTYKGCGCICYAGENMQSNKSGGAKGCGCSTSAKAVFKGKE